MFIETAAEKTISLQSRSNHIVCHGFADIQIRDNMNEKTKNKTKHPHTRKQKQPGKSSTTRKKQVPKTLC